MKEENKKELIKVDANTISELEHELKSLLKTRNVELKEQIKNIQEEQNRFEYQLNDKLNKIEKAKKELKPKNNNTLNILVSILIILVLIDVGFRIFAN